LGDINGDKTLGVGLLMVAI